MMVGKAHIKKKIIHQMKREIYKIIGGSGCMHFQKKHSMSRYKYKE
jgi:hypothetical protein